MSAAAMEYLPDQGRGRQELPPPTYLQSFRHAKIGVKSVCDSLFSKDLRYQIRLTKTFFCF